MTNLFSIHVQDCGEEFKGIYDFHEPGIGRCLVYLGVSTVIFLLIHAIIEFGLLTKIMYQLRRTYVRSKPHFCGMCMLDGDVKREKLLVNSMKDDGMKDYNLVLRNLTKYYEGFMAVRGVCLAVQRYYLPYVNLIYFNQ